MMRRTIGMMTGALVVGVLSHSAGADALALVGEGTISDFGSGFGGADQFPFAGESAMSPVSFSFSYDTDAAPVEIIGGRATYEFDGTGSWFQLGSSTIEFDLVEIRVGETQFGQGVISMSGFNTALGVNAGIQFESLDPIPMDLPTSIDLGMFSSFREFLIDSDQNQFLLPIVLGSVTSASVVPAPGALGVLGVGCLLGARRRR
jgi:hypothetical protein